MDPLSDDLIEKLLQASGLSCDDLLIKLQQYKVKMAKSTINKSSQEQDTVATTSVPNKNSSPSDDSISVGLTTDEKGTSQTSKNSQSERLSAGEEQKLSKNLSTSNKNQPAYENESLDILSDLEHSHKKAEKVKGTSGTEMVLNSEEKIESVSETCEVATDTLYSEERTEIVQEDTQNTQTLLNTKEESMDETLKIFCTSSINEYNKPSSSAVLKVDTRDKKKCERKFLQSQEDEIFEENSKTLVEDISEEESCELISANYDISMKVQEPVSKIEKIETKDFENSGSFVNSKTLLNQKDETIDELFENDTIAIDDDISNNKGVIIFKRKLTSFEKNCKTLIDNGDKPYSDKQIEPSESMSLTSEDKHFTNKEQGPNIREELLEDVSKNLGVLTKNADESFSNNMIKTFEKTCESSEIAENNPLINKINEKLKSILTKNINEQFLIKNTEPPKGTSYVGVSMSNSQPQPSAVYKEPSKNEETVRSQDESSSEKKIEPFQETFTVFENLVNDIKQNHNESQPLREKTFPILIKSQGNQKEESFKEDETVTNQAESLKKFEIADDQNESTLKKERVPFEINLRSDQNLKKEEFFEEPSKNETIMSTKNIQSIQEKYTKIEMINNQEQPVLEKMELFENFSTNIEEEFLEESSNSDETANNRGESVLKRKMKFFEESPTNAEEEFLEQFPRNDEVMGNKNESTSTKEIDLFEETSTYFETDYSSESTLDEKIELRKKLSRIVEEQFLEGSSKIETPSTQIFAKKMEEISENAEEEFLDESSKNDKIQYNQDELSSMKKTDLFEELSENIKKDCQNEPTLKKKREFFEEHSPIAQEEFSNESSKHEILNNQDESTFTNKMKLFEKYSANSKEEFLDECSKKDEILNNQGELASMKKIDQLEEASADDEIDCQNESTFINKMKLFEESSSNTKEEFLDEYSTKVEILNNQNELASMKKIDSLDETSIDNQNESNLINKMKLFEEPSANAKEECLDEYSKKDEIPNNQGELASMKKIDQLEETSADVEIDCQNESTFINKMKLFEESSANTKEEFLDEYSTKVEILNNQDELASMKKIDSLDETSTDNQNESNLINKMKLFEEPSVNAKEECLDEYSKKDEILNNQDELLASMKKIDPIEETSTDVEMDCQHELTLINQMKLFKKSSANAKEEYLDKCFKTDEILNNQDEASMKKIDSHEKTSADLEIDCQSESTFINKMKLFEEFSANAKEEFLDESSKKDEILNNQDEPTSMKKIDPLEVTATDVEIDCQNESTLRKKVQLIENHFTTQDEFLNESFKYEILDNKDEPSSMEKTHPIEEITTNVKIVDYHNETTLKKKIELFEESSTNAEEVFFDESSKDDKIQYNQNELSSMEKTNPFEETSTDVETDFQNESSSKKKIELFGEYSTTAQEEFLNKFSENEIIDNQDESTSMKKKAEFFEKSSKIVETADNNYKLTCKDQIEETSTSSIIAMSTQSEQTQTTEEFHEQCSKISKTTNRQKERSKLFENLINNKSCPNIDKESEASGELVTPFEYPVKSQKEDNSSNENGHNEISKDLNSEDEQYSFSKGTITNNVTPENSKVSQINEESLLNEENKIGLLSNQDEQHSNNDSKDTESYSAIKNYPGIDDHNYSNPNKGSSDFNQEVSVSSNDDVSKSEDDLRNIIRKQLSSLRNMKKSSGYFSDLKRQSVSFHSPKKKRKSCDLSQLTLNIENKNEESSTEETENETNSSKPKDTDNDFLISLSEETNFVIMNVTGGVDRLNAEESEEIQSKPEEVKENIPSSTDLEPEKILIDFDSVATIRKKIKIFEEQTDSEESSVSKEQDNKKSNNRYSVNKDDSIPKGSRKQEEPVILTIKKNLSDSFIEDPGVNKSVKNSEKSPFVSDSLEDFLNESSQLKISYSIPKLGAEEGLTENSKKSPYDNVATRTTRVEVSNENETPTKEKTKLIKAKTLAEMRRHMEKLKSKTQKILSPHSKKINAPKKEEPDSVKDTAISHVKEEHMSDISPHRNSFILFNRRKIWVPAKFKNRCVGVVNTSHKGEDPIKTATTPMPKTVQGTNRKLSLLSCLNEHKKSYDIKYKPGPLCKKAELQNLESRSKWTTEVKTLPKVYLEVFPEIGKPLDPQIAHLLPVFDEPIINEERAVFAISTLKTSKDTVEPNSFTFHIPYNNKQEKLVVRKPFQPETLKIDIAKNHKDPSTEIADILDDIIKYIEIKEIEHTLIKDDDIITDEQEDKVNEANFKNKKRRCRRKKLELELRRLNCKVVDVDVSTEEDKECTKPYCKMGCVCTSLLCESVFSNHCQLVECMFGCKCPPLPESEVTTFNNSLPAHTVSHLEDKAKKNLAKVEREFTQTLINTGRDVILVGTGGRNRMRASKTPKKYTDYIADIDEVLTEDFRKFPQAKDLHVKNCTVNVPKLNLEEIIPYCLCHKAYNCYCKGEMVDSLEKKPCDNKCRQIPKLRIVKSVNEESQSVHDSCARIRKVFSEYKERNKHSSYTKRLREQNPESGIDFNDFMFGKNEFDFLDQIIENETPKDDQTSSIKRNKRKQSFNLRNEGIFKYPQSMLSSKTRHVEKEFAIQRRKKKLKYSNIIEKDYTKKYIPIFDGEIKVSLKDNQDMLKFIGEENASLEYLRILPWRKVVESFRSGKMNIWSREKRSSALLCNAAGYFPPKGFIDIRKVLEKSDIINWILTDELPSDRPRDLMHLILTPRKNNFLIAGFCLKKIDSEKMASVLSNIHKQSEVLINKLPNLTEILINTPSRTETSKSSSQTQFIEMSELPTDTQLRESSTTIQPAGFISISKLAKSTTDSNNTPTVLNPALLKTANLKQITSDPLSQFKFSTLPTVQPTETKATVGPLRIISLPKKIETDPKLKSTETGKSIIKSHSNTSSPKSVDSVKIPIRTISRTSPSKCNGKTILIKRLPTTALNSTTTSSPRVNPQAVTLVRRYQEKLVDASVSQLNAKVFDKLNVEPSTETSEALSTSDEQPSKFVISKRIKIIPTPALKESNSQDIKPASTSSTDNKPTSDANVEADRSSAISKANKQGTICEDITFDAESHEQIDAKNYQSASSSKPSPRSQRSKTQKNPEELSDINPQTHKIQAESQASCLKNINNASAKLLSSRTVKCTHKDMYNNSKTLILTNKEFPRRELHSMDQTDVASKTLHLPLPKIPKKFRWRMIYLNSDFSYLSFVNAAYSIKYTDLMDVVKMSNNINSTIILRNKEFSDLYNHPFFGIYCVPGYQDRLFIGPYSVQEKHNIETLRYLQGKLIDTYIFNKMIGKKASLKIPEWLYEPQNRPRIPNGLIIDITEDDNTNVEKTNDIIYVVDNDSDMEDDTGNTYTSSTNFLKESLLCPPFVEILTAEELKTKKINRYIVTNIPHLGYFGACQRDNKAIEVYWPNDSRGFRFPNVTFAKNSLILYLSQIFHTIPQDFKINVIILTHVDLQSNKPVDPKYFSHNKSYICGEFGIYEKDSIPSDLLEHYQISSIESLLNSEEHSEEIINKMIRLFGLFLMSNEELRKHPEPQDIMQWAKSETYILKKLSDNYESEKADLRAMIRANLLKINERKRKRATNSNTVNSVKSNKSNTGDAIKVTATIEIEDSDEDEQTKNSQKKSKETTTTALISKTTSTQPKNSKAGSSPLQSCKTKSIPLMKSTGTITSTPKAKEISVLTADPKCSNDSRPAKRKETISHPKDSQETEPIFKKICTNSKILSGGTVVCKSNEDKPPQYSPTEERSVLKSKVIVKPARSLLKINDTDMRRYNITPSTSTDVPRSPVKISGSNNSNIIVHHSNVLTNKPNQNGNVLFVIIFSLLLRDARLHTHVIKVRFNCTYIVFKYSVFCYKNIN